MYNNSISIAVRGKEDLSEAMMLILYELKDLWLMCHHYTQKKEDNDI